MNGMDDYRAYYKSPIGIMVMRSDGESLTGLWFEGQKYAPDGSDHCLDGDSLAVVADTRRWLETYFSGQKPDFTPRLKLSSTPFRQMIADIMLQIPYGATTTYGAIAQEAAVRMERKRMSAQAVGGGVGHNPIAIIIPCHRVVGSDGSMTGYAGGIERKEYLLRLESRE